MIGKILESHKAWPRGDPDGRRADFTGVDISGEVNGGGGA